MKYLHLKPVLLLFLLLLITVISNAQQVNAIDGLGSKMSLYGIKNQSPILFIHFDKTIYSTNENVWFTAYLFNCADYKEYKTLSLTLVRDDNRAIVLEDKFVISNGFVFGNTFIPDSLSAGNYSFVATTNRLKNGDPEIVFTQPVTVKTDELQGFVASLNPVDTAVTALQQKILLLVNFTNIKEIPLSVPVSYYVGNASHPIITGAVKTTAGQYVFNIPSKLLNQNTNRLHVQVKYKKEVKEISIALPVPPQPAIVRFYPEGGYLVNNIPGTVGWEVKSAAGNPLGVNAILYQNKKAIDTLTTSSYGFGKFSLTPKAGNTYYVKLFGVNKKDTLYKLPAAITRSPALSLPTALVNDTLTVNLHGEPYEKLYLIVHNYKQLFFTTPVIIGSSNKKTVKFLLNGVPKGLAQITVIDSLGRPFAERMFFAHYNQKTSLLIATDMGEYATRKKVTVKLKLDSKADSGFVSVACVQENRIEINKKNDIETSIYLKNDVDNIPVRETYFGNNEADKQFLENILLVKGWRRYIWQDMLKTEPADTINRFENITFKGYVTYLGKSLKKETSIINFNQPLAPIRIGQSGVFALNDTDLITEPGKKLRFIVGGGNTQDYQIHLPEPYTKTDQQLAMQLQPTDYNTPAQESTQYMQLADNEHAIHLKEVIINTNRDGLFRTGPGGPGTDACGNYVCRYNVLNCTNHRSEPDNRPPVEGETYTGSNGPYHGCIPPPVDSDSVLKLKGIYAAQEFYPSDYSQVNPSAPEYLSTIYWKHRLKVSSDKDTEFSFYTSDITGKFKIVVQGVAKTDVVYGEKTFNVIKSK
ncbi:MAG: hypothetical protein JWQ79_264 [Mucilaginibacter sp.]|nr:hypothetical protein [Mucilaginibacter sp.]